MDADVGDGLADQGRILVQAVLPDKAAVCAYHLGFAFLRFPHGVGIFNEHCEVGGDDVQIHRMNAGGFSAFAEHGIEGKPQVFCRTERILGTDYGRALL